jgi:hypothetical protein
MAGNAQVADRMRKAAALMRRRGLRVGAFDGWATAGRSSTMRPRAVIVHHTAAAVDVDRILRDGRADLPGPLCNWALHKDGSWWLVASGRANHAGVGWLSSTDSYGVEATGPVPVTAKGVAAFPNYGAYVLGVACICEVEGWGVDRVFAHKETATPDGRKPDPAFGGSFPKPYRDMDRFRAQVKAAIGQPSQEEDMTPEQDKRLKAIEADADWLRKTVVSLRDEGVRMTAMGDPDGPSNRQINNLAHILTVLADLERAVAALANPPA